jgi:formate dehydrogenase iron-sulfur subunit
MKAILIDVTKCTGCEECVVACKKANKLEREERFPDQSEDKLSSRRFTTLLRVSEERFVRKQCLHCLEPSCVEACLVGAIEKTKQGPVIYDPDICIGCRYCMLACPVSIPRYEWDKKLPLMKKCDMCYERQQDGKLPACVEACPQKACTFGEREELLGQAHATIEAAPDKYMPHVYGEMELGGTSVFYITDTPLDVLGLPDKVGSRSIHSYTWPVLSKTPFLGIGAASFLTGAYWIINRRMEVQENENTQTPEREQE